MDYDGIVAGMTPLAKADFEAALVVAGSDGKVVANAAAAAKRNSVPFSSRPATTISDILTEKAVFNAAFASALRMKQIGRMSSVREKTANGAHVDAALDLVAAMQITKAMLALFGKDSLHSSEMEIEGLGVWLTGKGEWRSGALEIIIARAKELSRTGNYETIRDEMLPACTELFGSGAHGNVDELTRILDDASLNEIISLCNRCKAAARTDLGKARELLNQAKRIDAENSKNPNLVNPSIKSAEDALGWKGKIAGLMNWRYAFNKKTEARTYDKGSPGSGKAAH